MKQPPRPSRTPPIRVQRELRQEVGFRCPVDDCGNPYLTWHHFDPAWRDENHHRPQGMIALCLDHAARADGGAYPAEQLRNWKRMGIRHAAAIAGRFEWMRNSYVAMIGGNCYYNNGTIFQIGDRRCIWFARDVQGYQQLSFLMPTVADDARARIFENGWVVPPNITDMECPPSGKRLKVWYPNGDRIAFEFYDFAGPAEFIDRYATAAHWTDHIKFPVTAAEISERAVGSPIEFGPHQTTLPGHNIIRASFVAGNAVAVQIGPPHGLHLPESDEES